MIFLIQLFFSLRLVIIELDKSAIEYDLHAPNNREYDQSNCEDNEKNELADENDNSMPLSYKRLLCFKKIAFCRLSFLPFEPF